MLVKTVGRFAPDWQLQEPLKDVDWVIANGCMIGREALLKVGLFDEDFWQCNEDVDWSYRARKAGYRVVYVDRAAILHKGGSSADLGHKRVFSYGYFIGRNAFTFARKHGTIFQKIKLFLMVWVGVLGRIAFFTLDNAQAVGFATGSVGTIIAAESLEHVADPYRAVAEMHRVVRPGGMVIIAAPFIFPIHHEPDFTRFTPEGLSRLLSVFPIATAYAQGDAQWPHTVYGLAAKAEQAADRAGFVA